MKQLKQIIYGLIILITVISCGETKEHTLADSLAADSLKNKVVDIADFKKMFEGSIDNKYQIVMSLSKSGKQLRGKYAYTSVGSPTKVSGTIDEYGKITLSEYSDSGTILGTFSGKYEDNGIKGTWTKTNGNESLAFYLNEKTKTINDAAATCNEVEFSNEEGNGTKTTCLFNDYKTVSTGYVNEDGGMYWSYELFQKKNEKYVKVQNTALFNLDQDELLKLINERIKRDFTAYASAPDTKECFSEVRTIPTYKMNDLGIYFSGDEINFTVELGLPDFCASVGGVTVSFKISDIAQYLN